MERFEFQVGESFHRRRLDEFLFNQFTEFSKAYLRDAVKRELCEVNGFVANSGIELRENDFIEMFVEPDKAKSMKAQEIAFKIVHEDGELLVVDKERGMLVHPTHFERDGTLLNGLTFYLNPVKEDIFIRPHLVHRLDRETSGLIVIAKSAKSSRHLCKQIKKKRFQKKYLALVTGCVELDEGEIAVPIGRDAELKRHFVMEDGKESLSRYTVVERFTGESLLSLEPVTGRTNQLRIHLAHIGHPIVGDEVYGSADQRGLCLHASGLEFINPSTGEKMKVASESPDFIRAGNDGV